MLNGGLKFGLELVENDGDLEIREIGYEGGFNWVGYLGDCLKGGFNESGEEYREKKGRV